MKATQRTGKTLEYLVVEPDGYGADRSYPVVMLLHGFGAGMADLAGLAPAIDAEGYVYVCPNAPIPMQVGPGMVGYAWTQPGDSGTSEDARRAEALLATLFDEVIDEYHPEAGQLVLGGFSQGGMMTYQCGLPRPDMFSGLMALSARISDPNDLRARLPEGRTQPLFVTHGTADPLIPIEDAREAREFLQAEGYAPEYREYPMGHEITQAVLEDLGRWIRGVLPPLRVEPGERTA